MNDFLPHYRNSAKRFLKRESPANWQLKVCEEPKEDDYEELHFALLRDDLVEDATPAQQVSLSESLLGWYLQVEQSTDKIICK